MYNIRVTFMEGTIEDYMTKGYTIESDWLILYMLSGCKVYIARTQLREFAVEEVA